LLYCEHFGWGNDPICWCHCGRVDPPNLAAGPSPLQTPPKRIGGWGLPFKRNLTQIPASQPLCLCVRPSRWVRWSSARNRWGGNVHKHKHWLTNRGGCCALGVCLRVSVKLRLDARFRTLSVCKPPPPILVPPPTYSPPPPGSPTKPGLIAPPPVIAD